MLGAIEAALFRYHTSCRAPTTRQSRRNAPVKAVEGDRQLVLNGRNDSELAGLIGGDDERNAEPIQYLRKTQGVFESNFGRHLRVFVNGADSGMNDMRSQADLTMSSAPKWIPNPNLNELRKIGVNTCSRASESFTRSWSCFSQPLRICD